MSAIEMTLTLPRHKLRRAMEALRQTEFPPTEWRVLIDLANQIEAHLPKPRIPEPSTWAVVEAAHIDDPAGSWEFVRHSSGAWFSPTRTFVGWDDLIDPVLAREGV